MASMNTLSLILSALMIAPALAQDSGNVFTDAANNAKVHAASGFSCPAKVGLFVRDAVGERDPKSGMDYCTYSALDGVYGTIVLSPLGGPYDPKAALVPDFLEQEATGGKKIAERSATLGGARGVYTRTYETTSLEDLHYRVLFAASAVGNWAVQVTMEYASPRDDALEQEFLNAVYAEALRKIAAPK
jgi:hypothetical protein